MQNAEPKRRCSILKKRRSRSLSPKPLAEAKPRRSRRISFSGKNAVREFIGASENKETIWVASYEESTENHQFSTNQAIASSTMHSTKNDTISMQIDMDIDCSNISFNQPHQPPKQSLIPRPSNANSEIKTIFVSQQPKGVDQIAINDSDSKNPKLSMFQQLSKLQEQQQLQQQQQQHQSQKQQETKQMPVPRLFQTNKVDMEMSIVATGQQTSRHTIVQSRDISMDNSLDMFSSGHSKNNDAVSRQTNRNTVFDAKNMSLDLNHSNTGSFDLNKTNQHTADMSIMMERQPIRGSVICKSPKKSSAKSLEKTLVFDADIEVTDVTVGMRNTSYHPIQMESPNRNLSTLMTSITRVVAKPMEQQPNETVNDEMEMDESFVQKTDTMALVMPPTIFNQNKRATTYELMPVEMSITQPVAVKKANIRLLPSMLSHADKENDPRIIDLLNIDATATTNDDMSLDNTLKSESVIIENNFETNSVRRTIFDQNSLEMSDTSDDPKPDSRASLNVTLFNGGMATDRKGSLDLNEPIDINNTLKSEVAQPTPNIVRIDKKRQTIYYNESLELSNVSFDVTDKMVAEGTRKIPQLVDQSKNMSLDLDDTTLKANFPMPPPATNTLLNRIKRATTFANQSMEMNDNSMEQTHSNPTKKFNPNKTPFYFTEEKSSDLDISIASNSSIMNLDNTLQKQGIQLVPRSDNNFEIKLKRHTELFHKTISGSESGSPNISIHSVNAACVVSDLSNMNISSDPAIQGQNRETCYQHVSMVQDDPECRFANQTKTHQKTIIIDNDDVNSFAEVRPKRINDGTIYKNESILLDDKSIMDQSNVKVDSCCYLTDIGEMDSFSEKSKSSIVVIETSLEPSRLSFYEDEGDEDNDDDYLCNTKPQLIESYENVSNEDVARDHSMVSKQSFEYIPVHINDSHRSLIPFGDEFSETKQSILELPAKLLDMDEHEIFKKSSLLRRSGVHRKSSSIDGNDDDGENERQSEMNNAGVIVENQQEIVFKRPKSPAKMPLKGDESGAQMIVLGGQQQPSTSKESHIRRPSIIRRSINCDGPLDETSFLMNMTGDKPASELKLDFSGYKKFEGLATINDVLRNHQLRRNELARQVERWNYQLENNLPMESIDNEENSPEDVVESQNVEAPSWAFLWRNKIKWEIEQMKLEIQREFAERPPGAFLPVAPDISILILNKCKQLKNWHFDELWYFKGNIRLRSVALPAFSIIILYDPDIESIQRNVDMYGALKFVKIVTEYCPKMSRIQSACLHLKLRELRNLLPLNLTLMCDNSAELSAFDEKLNGLVKAAIARIDHLRTVCDNNHAFLKMEDGAIYIRKTMFCRRIREFQDYIIELNGIDTTGWHDVRTKPNRVLNEEVKALPNGMPFIEQFLINDKMYVPIISKE